MTIKRWKTLQRERIQDTRIFSIDAVTRQPPSEDPPARFFVIDTASWVNIFAYDTSGGIVLIRQYRQGTDSITLEVPGGIIDEGESPLQAAIRELREETGYEAKEWHEVGVVEVNPAIQTNKCHSFVALGAQKTSAQDTDEHEDIEIVVHPADALPDLIADGTITHSLVVAGAYSAETFLQNQS